MASENLNIVIKAVDKTKRSFRAVTMGLNAIKKVAFSMQTALIALGVAGFGFLIKKSLESTDALGKMADKIGIGTAELGGLRHAAELTGIASNTLDMGLQRMVRRISEAAAGSGEAKAALIELGLSANALNKLAPDQQFKAIADAMEGVTQQGEKVRLAMRLFDSEGVALVNTLKGGSAAIIEMEQEAERLGLRLSQRLVKGVEKANDAIGTLGSYITNIFNRAVGELAPTIEAATVSIREWIEATMQAAGGPKEFAKTVAVGFLTAAKSVVTAMGSMLNGLVNFANTAGQAINSLIDLLPSALPTMDALNQKIIAVETRIVSLSEKKIGLNKRAQDIRNTSLGKAEKELITLNEQVKLGEYASTFKPIELFKFDGALIKLDELKAGIEAVGGGTGADDGLVSAAAAAAEKTKADKIAESESIRNITNAYYDLAEQDQLYRQNRSIELTHQYLAKQSAMQKAAQQKDFGDVKEEGRKTLDALGGHYKAAFALNKAFAVKDALVNTYQGISKALASAPYPLNIALAAAAALQGFAQVKSIRSTQFREKGGPMSAGSPYIVGERGPELIVPNQAANVVPNDQLGGGNFTINISANDTAGFDDLLTKRRGTLMNLINQSLNERGRPALA